MPHIARDCFEIAEPVLDQCQPAGHLLDEVRAQRDCSLIPVDADHLAIGGCENGARIAAGAEGAVDVDAAVTRLEEADRLATEHGNVECRSASDSRTATARHHFCAPTNPRSPKPSRTGARRTPPGIDPHPLGPSPRVKRARKRFIARTPYRLDGTKGSFTTGPHAPKTRG